LIALRNKDKQNICTVARSIFPKGTELWAYGSRIKGTSHDGSDLDLVIKSKEKSPDAIDNLIKFKEKLQSSNIPILIQVLDWNYMPKSFKNNISQHYQVLCSINDD